MFEDIDVARPNIELSAYGTPTRPPTVESIARTISGTVIVQGDSCGLKSCGNVMMLFVIVIIGASSAVVRFVVMRVTSANAVCSACDASPACDHQAELVKTFGAEERHHHHPRHVDGGEHRGEQADDPKN